MMKVHPILGEAQGRQDARMQDGLDGPQVRSLLNAVRGGEVHAGDDGPQLFTLRPPPAGRISVEAHDFRRPDGSEKMYGPFRPSSSGLLRSWGSG